MISRVLKELSSPQGVVTYSILHSLQLKLRVVAPQIQQGLLYFNVWDNGLICYRAGVPLVVARKMQQGPLLLGRLVTSVDAAVAAAAEGANFVLLQVSWLLAESAVQRACLAACISFASVLSCASPNITVGSCSLCPAVTGSTVPLLAHPARLAYQGINPQAPKSSTQKRTACSSHLRRTEMVTFRAHRTSHPPAAASAAATRSQ